MGRRWIRISRKFNDVFITCHWHAFTIYNLNLLSIMHSRFARSRSIYYFRSVYSFSFIRFHFNCQYIQGCLSTVSDGSWHEYVLHFSKYVSHPTRVNFPVPNPPWAHANLSAFSFPTLPTCVPHASYLQHPCDAPSNLHCGGKSGQFWYNCNVKVLRSVIEHIRINENHWYRHKYFYPGAYSTLRYYRTCDPEPRGLCARM